MDENKLLFSNRDLRKLIFPLIADQFLQSFVGMADSVMASSAEEAAVSGVSLVDTVMFLVINIFTAAATGGAVVAGQYLGKGRDDMACKAANELLTFTLKLSLLVTLLAYGGRELIIDLVFGDIQPDVMYNCRVYMLFVFGSIPMIALYNAGTAIFRAMGDSSIAMKTSLLMNGVNLGGNAILIYGFHRGVEGVAIPTLISRTLACVLVLAAFHRQDRRLHLLLPISLKTDRVLLRKILYIGVPNGLENSMFQLGKILVLRVVAGFGTASIAANAVCNSISTFCLLSGLAMGYALLTVAAQCVGAGDYGQVTYYTRKLMKAAYASLIGVNVVVLLLLPVLVGAYDLSAEARGYVFQIMIFYCLCVAVIWPFSFLIPNTLRAAADVKFTMLLSIVSMWIFRIGFCVLLGVYLNMGVLGVWAAMAVDWLFRGICFGVRYVRGKWRYKSI